MPPSDEGWPGAFAGFAPLRGELAEPLAGWAALLEESAQDPGGLAEALGHFQAPVEESGGLGEHLAALLEECRAPCAGRRQVTRGFSQVPEEWREVIDDLAGVIGESSQVIDDFAEVTEASPKVFADGGKPLRRQIASGKGIDTEAGQARLGRGPDLGYPPSMLASFAGRGTVLGLSR